MYSGVNGDKVLVNSSEVENYKNVNWYTAEEKVTMYSGVDGHMELVDADAVKDWNGVNWYTGHQTITMYSADDGAKLEGVKGWQINSYVENDQYYTGYQTMQVQGTEDGKDYKVWAYEVEELGKSGKFETQAMKGWKEHNEAVEAERQAELARQAATNQNGDSKGTETVYDDTLTKGNNILNAKINPDDYNEDEEYDKNANDPLRGSDAKDRERKQIENSFGKRGSKEREQESGELHDAKKGGRNDDNKSWGDLKKGNYWIEPQTSPSLMDKASEITGLTGTALVIYLIISEGSRLFPPRNLVPIP